ncbi:hypothetical protein B0H34DRAFT_247113 [Crassisporium funariophilum]|nr:hypothetical protein B0H34DRAFT_247113 [Crassisporium funariophilum]
MNTTKAQSAPSRLSQKFIQFILLSTILIAICLAAFVAGASCLVVAPLDFQVPNDPALSFAADISFAAEVIAADPIGRTFVMDWYPTPNVGCSSSPNLVADIYLDHGILDSSSPSYSILPPYPPVYRYNVTALCEPATSTSPAFRTISKLLASEISLGYAGPTRSTLQNYPFDVYFAPFMLHAVNPGTGEFYRLNITRSFGIAVNFQVTLQTARVVTDSPPWLRATLRVERSKATQIFVVIVAITNWLTAAAFLTISAATLIYQPHKIYSEMFVVPVGSLFAFTSIRASLPGAPSGFGTTIDLYTILPVLVVMSICSSFLLLVVLYRRILRIGENEIDSSKPCHSYVMKTSNNFNLNKKDKQDGEFGMSDTETTIIFDAQSARRSP